MCVFQSAASLRAPAASTVDSPLQSHSALAVSPRSAAMDGSLFRSATSQQRSYTTTYAQAGIDQGPMPVVPRVRTPAPQLGSRPQAVAAASLATLDSRNDRRQRWPDQRWPWLPASLTTRPACLRSDRPGRWPMAAGCSAQPPSSRSAASCSHRNDLRSERSHSCYWSPETPTACTRSGHRVRQPGRSSGSALESVRSHAAC
jgi:hypothetical protein